MPSGCQRRRLAVDQDVAVAHGDAVAGQADDALDPDLARSPGQRNTTTSPRSGSAPRCAACSAARSGGQRSRAVAVRDIWSPAIRRRSAASAPSSRTARRTARRSRPWPPAPPARRRRDRRRVLLQRRRRDVSGHGSVGLMPVPPTVMRSMRKVGWPTPTGTPWPFLPQVPMPGSSSKSLPTMVTRCRSVGPLPISMAPLTGAPTLPFSIL